MDVSEELAPSETMSEEDREEIAAEEAEEAQEEAAEEAAEMGLNNDAAEAVPSRSNMTSAGFFMRLGSQPPGPQSMQPGTGSSPICMLRNRLRSPLRKPSSITGW